MSEQEKRIKEFVAGMREHIVVIRDSGGADADKYVDILTGLLTAYVSGLLVQEIDMVNILAVLLPALSEKFSEGKSWLLDELANSAKSLFDVKVQELVRGGMGN